ncbi:glycosyltransferase [Dokdonella sp.]|uniref:glycosyltransferase n=1 Tax=Dokdonella sp. TaxID=2291710 RepID=UPI0027B9A5A4|nr:glycosyltransferase [Dokdonella sp.]
MTSAAIRIVTIKPKGYLHSETFAELAQTFRDAFQALGAPAQVAENRFDPAAVNLILGWHLLDSTQEAALPAQCILYNLEQMDERNQHLRDRLVRLSERCEIWDYSRRNVEILHRAGISKGIQLVPIGTMPGLTRIPVAPDQDIDVLFYGSINDRRRHILEALQATGLRVHAAFGVYGRKRDALISRAKVVLNLHFYESSILEMVRLSYLWANRKAVVAECRPETDLEAGLEGAARFVPYEQLVAACQDLVADAAARAALESRAYEIMSARSEAEILRKVLAGEAEILPTAEPAPAEDAPLCSLVIPVFNKVEYTQQCVDQLRKSTPDSLYELIFIDNASSDGTADYLAGLTGRVRVITNPDNRGFVDACNQGAALARGRYLVFLNNDTAPLPGWLEALVGMAEGDPTVGAAGAQLVYPDGRLQEAGGLIFSDGSGWNFGRFADPLNPAYLVPAEVDYCSGAALLVRRELFERLGGFDRRYAPAYYEDTDLCFGIRSLGYKVMYCPSSTVLHFEGITAGTDLSSGFKRYQAINREKFVAKWAAELARQDPPPSVTGHPPATADRRRLAARPAKSGPAPHILIVDPFLPLHDRASGSLRLFRIILILRALKYDITYIARNGLGQENYQHQLEALGVKVYATDPEKMAQLGYRCDAPPINLARILGERPCHLAWLSFYDIAEQYLPEIRRYSPGTTVVVDTVDVHFLRETRQAELAGDAAALEGAARTRERELRIYGQADRVVTVTEADATVLREAGLTVPTTVIPNIHPPVGETPGWEARKGLVFVGNFNHTPNIDAALWLVRDILPKVRALVPGTRLTIVGPNPPAELQALASPAISVTGWVPDTAPHLDAARVSVAPLRVGAGMKGKVGEALSRGLPVVTTSIGAEGMGLEDGRHVLVADEAEAFASAVARLLQDRPTWEALGREGRAFITATYGVEGVGKVLQELVQAAQSQQLPPGLDQEGESRIYDDMYDERRQSNPEALTLAYWKDHFATRTALRECPTAGRLLDLGCGTGEIDIWLARSHRHLQILGVDLSDTALSVARSHVAGEPGDLGERLVFHRGTLDSIDTSGGLLDGCLASHVFEHLRDHHSLFLDLHRILKPGAKVVVVVPNGHHHDDPTHVWHFSPDRLEGLLRRYLSDLEVRLSEEGDQISATGHLKPMGEIAEAQGHAAGGKIVAMLRIKNESEWIAEVLASIERIADEIVILDDHSTDDTVRICRTFRKVVALHEQCDRDVDEVRDKNILLAMALERDPDWILAMDGDEVLEESAAKRIRDGIRSAPPQVATFAFEWLYFWNDREHYRVDGKYHSLWHPRLLRMAGQDRQKLAFRNTGHGGNFHCGSLPANVVGLSSRLDVKVKHYGYLHRIHRERKLEFYRQHDPEAAAQGYYDHLVDETGMQLLVWKERPFSPAPSVADYFKNARPEVARLVPLEAKRILDVGCAAGALGASIKSRGAGTRVHGIEGNPQAARLAARVLDGVWTADLDQLGVPPPFEPHSFDCIILADVLEHLKDPPGQLSRFKGLLAPRGCLVLSLPNVRFFGVVHDLLVRGRWTYEDEGILDRTHLKFFTRSSMLELLAAAGFQAEVVETVTQPADGRMLPLLAAVSAAGGDVFAAREDLQVFQYLVRARLS